MLLTTTEDVKLADFGLVREYTELRVKPTRILQDESSWITSYAQYYLNLGTGPIHWMAPEFLTGHYTENADVFSLGSLFFAILQRDFIAINTCNRSETNFTPRSNCFILISSTLLVHPIRQVRTYVWIRNKTKYSIFSYCSCCRIVKVVFPSLKAITQVATACYAHAVKETKSKKVKVTTVL